MPSTARNSTKNHQTRLVFSPLSPASPAAAVRYTAPNNIRVTAQYDGSTTPSKRPRLDKNSDGVSIGSAFAAEELVTTPSTQPKVSMDTLSLLPPPRSSLQADVVDSSRGTSTDSDTASDSGPRRHVIPNVFSRRGPASSDPRHRDGPSTPKARTRLQNMNARVPERGQSKRKAKLKQSQIDLSMVPAGASSSPQAELRGSHRPVVSSPIDLNDISSRSGEDDIVSATVTRRHLKKAPIAISSDDSDGNSGSKSPLNTQTEVKGPSSDPHANPERQLNSEMGRTNLKAMSTPRRRTSVRDGAATLSSTRHTRSMARARPDPVQETTEVELLDEDESDDEVVLSSPAKRRHRIIASRQRAKSILKDGDEESEDDIQPSPIKRRARVHHLVSGTGHESIEPPAVPLTPVKSSRQQEQEDIDEDLEDLRSSGIKTARTRVRVASSMKNEKQRQLELLRRRRAGEKIDGLASDSGRAALPKRALYDSETAEEALSVADEDDEYDQIGESGIETVRQSLRADADHYDEDFVVEDDHALGAPSELVAAPLEFTRHAHKKAIEHFKDAVEWMVQKKLNPAFNRDDPVYRTAFFKLDDEVKGYSSSRFMSAAWGAHFSRALRARPVFYAVQIPTLFDHKCDACNRSGHPAKWKITFGGKAYHHNSLEDISDDEEDEDAGDDAQSYDSKGNVIPSLDVQYFVGRFCKANAETAHTLSHWRYSLNQWVLDWLQNEGYTTAEKILEREKWSIRKKRDYANEVVDTMEEKGEIKALYRDFKHNLEAAREAKPSRYHAEE